MREKIYAAYCIALLSGLAYANWNGIVYGAMLATNSGPVKTAGQHHK